jgi:hypothetical protein
MPGTLGQVVDERTPVTRLSGPLRVGLGELGILLLAGVAGLGDGRLGAQRGTDEQESCGEPGCVDSHEDGGWRMADLGQLPKPYQAGFVLDSYALTLGCYAYRSQLCTDGLRYPPSAIRPTAIRLYCGALTRRFQSIPMPRAGRDA